MQATRHRGRIGGRRREHLRGVLWGPERVRIEYVEHKPTFSLT